MALIKRIMRHFFFSFIGTDVQRMIVSLQNGPQPKNPDYVLLAPNQAQALHTMQKYAPAQQVRELFELYEKVNTDYPVNPLTAVRIAKKDILQQPEQTKVWHR